jgi:hypothetical protein
MSIDKNVNKLNQNLYTTEQKMKRIGELIDEKENAGFFEKIKINKEIMSLRRDISKHVSPKK